MANARLQVIHTNLNAALKAANITSNSEGPNAQANAAGKAARMNWLGRAEVGRPEALTAHGPPSEKVGKRPVYSR
jgi:hypothetical protein